MPSGRRFGWADRRWTTGLHRRQTRGGAAPRRCRRGGRRRLAPAFPRAALGATRAAERLAEEALGKELPALSAFVLARLVGSKTPTEAAAVMWQAQRQHPANFWIHYTLGRSLYTSIHPDRATLDEAAGTYWAAIALRPDNAPAHVNLGLVLQDKGDLSDAVAGLKKAIELDPKFVNARITLGNVLRARAPGRHRRLLP